MESKEDTVNIESADEVKQSSPFDMQVDELEIENAQATVQDGEDVITRESEAEAKAEEYLQRYLRAQADFDNFRRRSRQEREQFAKYASMKLLEQLIPVVDNLERALAASKDNSDLEALTKGVEMIYRQIEQVLEQEGLKKIEAVGIPFNPEFHEAVMQVDSDEHEEGIVVEEVQKGYILFDRVLRPAMVKVST